MPTAELFFVPELHKYIARSKELQELTSLLLDAPCGQFSMSSRPTCVVIHGMPGTGKSVLAAAVVRLPAVREAFPDGIIWLTIGQQPSITTRQSDLSFAQGGGQQTFRDWYEGRNHLSRLMKEKKCLVVLDDVWEPVHAEAFRFPDTLSRLVITSRDANVAKKLDAAVYPVKTFTPDQALELFALWTDQKIEQLPREAETVAKECGYLPLALAMVGAMVRRNPESWRSALNRLRSADLDKLKTLFPNYEQYADLYRALAASFEALPDEKTRQRYLDFAVFPEEASVPGAVLHTWWGADGMNQLDAQDLLDEFTARALMRSRDAGLYQLHDLQGDFLKKKYPNLTQLHTKLLAAYRHTCGGQWAKLKADGYIHEHLIWHLFQAEQAEEGKELLFDFNWLAARLRCSPFNSLISDYELAEAQPQLADTHRALDLARGALRLAAHVLAKDPRKLPSQLTGRLLGFEDANLQRLLESTRTFQGYAWLRPLAPCLTAPGGAELRTFRGHDRPVSAVAVLPDGRRAISASWDATLKLWDFESGAELRTFRGHISMVTAVTVLSDGRRAISASDDGSLKLWDVESGAELRTFNGHTDSIYAVALLPDERRALSASRDQTLKLWDIESGVCLTTYCADASIYALATINPTSFVAGDGFGRMHFLKVEGKLPETATPET